MSEDLAEGKSTSHKAELEINWEYYGDFVRDVEHKHITGESEQESVGVADKAGQKQMISIDIRGLIMCKR